MRRTLPCMAAKALIGSTATFAADPITPRFWDNQLRLLTAVQGGDAPEVATLDQIWVGAFAKAGAVMPLDETASKAGGKP